MRLVCTGNTGTPCPACGAFLEAEPTWECDGEPYPDQEVACPACAKMLRVHQYVVTDLETP